MHVQIHTDHKCVLSMCGVYIRTGIISFGLTHVALLLTFAFLLAILLVDWLLCNSTTLLNRLLPHSCYGVAMIQCRFPIVLSL